MPWMETCLMEERIKFVLAAEQGDLSLAALCRQYGISRKTRYKWFGRFKAGGLAGMDE